MTTLALIVVLLLGACRTPGDSSEPTDTGPTDADGDGTYAWQDCDDQDAEVFPGADETCNERDDDCDGDVDEGVGLELWADDDGDGWGDVDTSVTDCEETTGWATQPGDCDDADPDVHPDAEEACDEVDNDCDGVVDGGDAVDATSWYQDADGDGWGDEGIMELACEGSSAMVRQAGDCDDDDPQVNPEAEEICDGVDQDCDGDTDEGVLIEFWADTDGDGFGNPAYPDLACEADVGFVDPALGEDCDDTDPAIHPQAEEACNELDDDCDGELDEGCDDSVE